MIYETIVTTKFEGRFNIAPMGVSFPQAGMVSISPYNTSHTYINLSRTGVAVVNFVDNVELFAHSVVTDEIFPWFPAERVDGWVLEGAYMYFEVRVRDICWGKERSCFLCEVLCEGRRRYPYIFNRAQALVIEAAILVSRLKIYPREKILTFFSEYEGVVLKTGGLTEKRAWQYLKAFLGDGENL